MSLLDKIYRSFQNYLISEYEQAKKTRLFRVSPLIKLIITIWLIIFVNYILKSFYVWLNIIFLFTIAAIILKIPMKRYLKLIFYIGILFPLIISIPLIFLELGTPIWTWKLGQATITITDMGIFKARDFIFRILANICVLAFFILSTPFSHIIQVFKQLHFPSLFLTLLVLTYRYFYLFFESLVKILRADNCRRFEKYPFKKRFSHFSTIFGMLLLRSVHRGENVYKSMLARGYSGTLPVLRFNVSLLYSIIYAIGIITFTITFWICFL